MGRAILKMDGSKGPMYFEYSTIVDAPVSRPMPLDDFKHYYQSKYGTEGMRDLPERLMPVEETGSSFHGETFESSIICNRAGEKETCLTLDEFIAAYYPSEPAEQAAQP